jgi:hypothetical protein
MLDKDEKSVNEDGSVDVYVGPKAPDGLESSWIPSMDKKPVIWLRLYGPASRIPEADIYEVTMQQWRISERRAAHARRVFAVARGIVRAVFVPTGWTASPHPGRKMMTGRGDPTLWRHFLHTPVAHPTPVDARSPILHVNC